MALDHVISGLRDAQYQVRAIIIPASAVGAPHRRERLFILGVRQDVADACGKRFQWRGGLGVIVKTRALPADEQPKGLGKGGLWPTPTVCGNNNRRGSGKSGDGLSTAVKWPTPRTGGMCGGSGAAQMMKDGLSADEVKKIWSHGGGQLNPDWVECLMGLPIGWTNPDVETPEPWPGWPAPMPGRAWMTPGVCQCGSTSKTSGRPLEKSTHLQSQAYTERGAGQYAYEPPRIAANIPNRAKRLKAIGNCNPPQQYMPMLGVIQQIDDILK